MRRLVLAALLGAALAGPAAAQEAGRAEALAAARVLVETLGTRDLIDRTLTNMRGALIAGLQPGAPRLSEQQVAEVVDQFLMPEFLARSGEVLDATAAIYAGRLSVEEMRQIAEFYRTPLGAKLLALTPEVTAESVRFGQAWGTRVAQDAFAKHREALRARGFHL